MRDSNINIINGDCMEALKKMPDKCFDLAIVDPPYGIDYQNEKLNRKSNSKFKDIIGDKKGDIDYKELISEWLRVCEVVIVWGALNFIQDLPHKGTWICWDKRTKIEADNVFGCPFEMAWCSINHGYDKICRIMHGGVINADGANTPRIHPTQKPVALYKWLLKNYAKEGDKILDTHFGSGSIAIACWDMGYDLDAYELDKDYYEASIKRLELHKKQERLF